MSFAREILPVFQIIQSIAIPVLLYKVLMLHTKRLKMWIEREEKKDN